MNRDEMYILDISLDKFVGTRKRVRGIGPEISASEFFGNAKEDEKELQKEREYKIFYYDILSKAYRATGYYTPYGSGTMYRQGSLEYIKETVNRDFLEDVKKEVDILEDIILRLSKV